MSVVAGCSLLDGIILGADSRVTFQNRGTYRDTLQKIIFVTNHTAIGFVGNVATAAHLLKEMKEARCVSSNAVLLRHWLPRFFAYKFAQFPRAAEVTFMVGSVIPGRPNVINKAAAAQAVVNAVHSRPAGGINTISSSFLQIMASPTSKVCFPDQPEGLLYTMKSPSFIVRNYEPFGAVAIGSGKGLEEKVLEVSDQIFFGTTPNDDVNWLGRSMNHFLRSNNVQSVGGSFPIVKITSTGLLPMSRQTVFITKGGAYELLFEHDRWVQHNRTTGDEIRLELPWELDQALWHNQKFDDLRPMA